MQVPQLRCVLSRISRALRDGAVLEWRVESEMLLRHVLGLPRSDFLTLLYAAEARLTGTQTDRLSRLLEQRLDGEPLAYIVGTREFHGLEFAVTPDVLIPRQETELAVDIALEFLARKQNPQRVVDAGTGSGAIALAIAARARDAKVLGTDVSRAALDVARLNAKKLVLSHRVEFALGEMLEHVAGPIDIVVSNPPYIPTGEIDGLQREIHREPRLALDGGAEGLDPFRKLLSGIGDKLTDDGVIICELMPDQMDTATRIARALLPRIASSTVRRDLAGAPRALVLETASLA